MSSRRSAMEVAQDPHARAIMDGFRINWMNMRDAHTGRIMWESGEWDNLQDELVARVPKEILNCRVISREINFSSVEIIENFRLQQKIYFHGQVLEEWEFQFGFVIPGSTNTWQQTIEAADSSEMLPADMLSGNILIETLFYDADNFVSKTRVRVYYV
eukprot:GILJ01003635.1.p1 GENE.GILJ01003635.1~~GILJ01003635.1.p1  ORF type:complete len:158 (-),score=11.47 GILJ01003635.1:119-592(-)